MDIRKIKTLIEMLEASNLNEIEVSQGEESVRISKSSGEIKFFKIVILALTMNLNQLIKLIIIKLKTK